MNADDVLAQVVQLCREAGAAIMRVYERGEVVADAKADGSPLTEADLASHRVLVDGLTKLTPDIPVLSEESKAVPWSERSGWQRLWLVDPLDGTKEFIKRNGEFTVNVALIEAGEAVAGVVYAPALDRCYWGSLAGAFRQDGEAAPETITVAGDPAGAARIVASRSHNSAEVAAFLDQLEEHECVAMGSSLKLCLVADGSAHLYPRLGPTMEWDTAAAHAVVTAAGGQVETATGEPLRYNRENLLNPHFIVSGSTMWDWRSALRKSQEMSH